VKLLQYCRLYDYDTHRWLDFDGQPPAPIELLLG
jgi:hypothetical protein